MRASIDPAGPMPAADRRDDPPGTARGGPGRDSVSAPGVQGPRARLFSVASVLGSSGSLRRNTQWLLLGNAVYAAGYWAQYMMLARAGGPAAIGSYAYALALAAPAVGFASLNLRGLLASDTAGAYSFRDYLTLRAVAITIAMLAVMAIGSATKERGLLLAILVPVSAMRFAESLSDLYYGAWQRRERMAVIGWSLAINGVGSGVLMAAALVLGAGVSGGAAGAAIGAGVALVFVYHRTTAAEWLLPPTPSRELAWRRVLRLAVEAAPLGGISLLSALQSSVPRYFIRASAGEAALGLFAAANQLPVAGGLVVAALGSAAVPRLASLHASGDTAGFRALTRRLLFVGAALGGAGVALSAVVGRQLLSLLYDPSFASAGAMLVVLSAAAGFAFVASLQGYALTSARVIVVQPVILGLVILVLAIGCAVLVPRFGAIGAAWAIAAASALHVLTSWAAFRLPPNVRR